MRVLVGSDLFRSPLGDDSAAMVAAFGTEIDNPVGHFDDFQVVFDDNNGVAHVRQFVQHPQQVLYVSEVQAGGGFVEDVEGMAGGGFAEFGGEFDALGFPAGKFCRRLAQGHVGKADFVEYQQGLFDLGKVGEEGDALFNFHVQDVSDVLPAIANFQGFPVVSFPLAYLTIDIHIGQEVHFDFLGALSLAVFTSASFNVETEPAGSIAADLKVVEYGRILRCMWPDYCGVCGRWGIGRFQQPCRCGKPR